MNVLNAQTMFGKLLRLAPEDGKVDLEVWDTELGIWLTLAVALRQEQAMAQGIPVLRGPYIVDYTDIPHDGDKKTLWTPQVGDVLLRLFPDWQSGHLTQWDHGTLFIGQNVDGTGSNYNPNATWGVNAFAVSNQTDLEELDTGWNVGMADASAVQHKATAYVFHSADPIQIQLAQTGGTDPGSGHVELYALVARAIAP